MNPTLRYEEVKGRQTKTSSNMYHDDSLSDRRKREREFKELTRKNREWMDKELDALAELLLDIWLWKKEPEDKKDKPDETGSTHAGS